MKKIGRYLALFASCLLIAIPNPALCQQEIDVEQISKSVRLIGRLGKPLGEMIDVTGIWELPDARAKDYSPRFRILTIDGKEPKKTIVFHISSLSIKKSKDKSNALPSAPNQNDLDGKKWKLRVFESGEYTVVPNEYWKKTGHPAMRRRDPFESQLIGFKSEIKQTQNRK